MSTRRGILPPRNSNIVWVRGVIDDADPENADGTPKYIDDATATWTILDAGSETDPEIALATGSSIASGSASAVGSGGTYLIALSHSIAYVARNWLHVALVTQDGFHVDLMARFDGITRSGDTPVT